MAFLHFSNMLRVGLSLAALFVLGAFLISCVFIVRSFDSFADKQEVSLTLDTNDPNLFSTIHAVKAGYEDGRDDKPLPRRRYPLPKLQANVGSFELLADPQAPLLRYQEPNPWKRWTLLCLGASDQELSLAWVLYFALGSWLLLQLLLDVTPATPFTFANARRLRGLGLLVLGLDLVQEVACLVVRALVPAFQTPGLAEPLSHYVRFSTETTLPGWEVGVLLLIIAAVYRRGVELSQEAELTI